MKGGRSKPAAKYADSKLSVKRSGKADKDPEKPKKASSAFFVFMEDFRKQFKEKHPNNKSVANVGKAGGVKWKSLTEAEKAPYVEEAEKRKKEYEKNLLAYNNKLAGEAKDADEESDKHKSEANAEDDESSGEEEEDD